MRATHWRAALIGAMLAPIGVAAAQEMTPEQQAELTKLAKAAQNPVANMISFPLQLNTSYGGIDGTANVLNIQPVYPFELNPKWNLITRTILPIVWQPTGVANTYFSGLGSTNISGFLSPAKPGKLIWGAGLALNLPSTSPQLAPLGGSRKWSAGPTAVVLTTPGHWVFGIVASQTWSFAGPTNYPYWSLFYTQLFVNYNLEKGWYLTSAPIITANWTASGSNVWTVPIGGGLGRIVKLGGKLPVNFNISAYGYGWRPAGSPTWTLRTQAALLLPKE